MRVLWPLIVLLIAAKSHSIELATSKDFAIFLKLLEYSKGKVDGALIDNIKCGFSRIGQGINIGTLPWKRLQKQFSSQSLQGYFPAFSSHERDQVGDFYPLLEDRIVWVSKKNRAIKYSDNLPPKTTPIGVSLGGWASKFLHEKNFKQVLQIKGYQSLAKALRSDRIEVVLVSSFFIEKLRHILQDKQAINIRTLFVQPVGLYLNPKAVEKNKRSLLRSSLWDCNASTRETLQKHLKLK